jgi:thioredoxin-dependent peroxiredoxin
MRPLLLAAVPLLFALGCTPGSAPSAQPAPTTSASAQPSVAPTAVATELSVGQAAPDFATTDQDGKPVHLAEMKGHFVVVYFYPKDETPGCTHEACAFRDAWSDLQKKRVLVVGISSDTADSHKAFAKNHQLPFTLVSDPNGDIAARFGVPMDKTKGYINRQSFVVAPDGTLKKIYRKVDVTVHAQQIAEDTAS